jgi:hypothetical protein
MKKMICLVALAAMSFGTVFANGVTPSSDGTMQTDTTKKVVKKKTVSTSKRVKKHRVKKDTVKMLNRPKIG